MSTPSQLYFGKGFFLCFATQILHPSGHSVAKKAGTAWEHWTSQIDDHLKPSTVAKRCTSLKSRKSPALRGFVAGRWALATTFLYPSTKIERLQSAGKVALWRCSFSEIDDALRGAGLPRSSLPPAFVHTRPSAAEIPVSGAPPLPPLQTRHTGVTRPRQGFPPACLPRA